MSNIIIKVENLSKQYQLGQVGTGTLRRDFQRWYSRIRGKEDPTLKIGQENNLSGHRLPNIEAKRRSRFIGTDYRSPDLIWALRDINFEVRQGEVLGIIGKNGAGKSTLLKILSQVTSPTTGQIKVKGRIASLLEVGTGFHPELTGRENIFLNGAILGMTKSEIRSRFDEIVDFSGIEKYIDTPVKRYSSGMYVRLAFAVAAHLEPEILIVDEVLAVGDAEFQTKCLGKMQDVSQKDGRTVLFVSHNMAAIRSLCNRGILIVNGSIRYASNEINGVVEEYIKNVVSIKKGGSIGKRTDRTGTREIFIDEFNLTNSIDNSILEMGTPIILLIKYISTQNSFRGKFLISINTMDNQCILFLDSSTIDNFPVLLKPSGSVEIVLSNDFALPIGKYFINIAAFVNGILADYIQYSMVFDVVEGPFFKTGKTPIGKGLCLIKQNWEIYDKE